MKEIKRYSLEYENFRPMITGEEPQKLYVGMMPNNYGDWVTWGEHRGKIEQLQARIKELESELKTTAECVKEIVEKDLQLLCSEILFSDVVGMGEQYQQLSDIVSNYLRRHTKHYSSSKNVINEIKAQGIEEAISKSIVTYQLDFTPDDTIRAYKKSLKEYVKILRGNDD
ncbi:hypothetical protein RHO12_03385 [Orbus sturtevantii]|uniref:hypothetical protein n=1 Tax=Orbus sturtevantii TaxID=3074109 RepID=UPI00370D30CF